MTSSASMRTQSAAGKPSIRAMRPNCSFMRSASFVAMDATCRVERPDAVRLDVHAEAAAGEVHALEVDDGGFVFDDEHQALLLTHALIMVRGASARAGSPAALPFLYIRLSCGRQRTCRFRNRPIRSVASLASGVPAFNW